MPLPDDGRVLGDHRITRAYDENAEYWISMIRAGSDPFRTLITDPALMDAIGSVDGLDVLDAGCGEGYLSRSVSSAGAASVIGVDTTRAFVDAATELSTPRCTFLHADVADLPIAEDSIDLVVANRLPHALTDQGRRFHEFARVLRPRGRLIVLGPHPCFYSSRADRAGSTSGMHAVDDYVGGRIVEQHFDVGSVRSPAASVQKILSLEAHIGSITAAGFVVTGLREPRPTPDQVAEDPRWSERFPRPLFLLVEARLD